MNSTVYYPTLPPPTTTTTNAMQQSLDDESAMFDHNMVSSAERDRETESICLREHFLIELILIFFF
jgi:hypothetical protein